MRAKYFTASTLDEATQLAYGHFGADNTSLKIDVISGSADADTEVPAESGAWVIIAVEGAPHEINNMDALFALYYEQDGVYLEIYESRGAGKPIDGNELTNHLRRKNINNLAVPVVQSLVSTGFGSVKIAPPQKEYIYGEDMTVVISGDEREASVRLLEPEPGGATLSVDEVKKKLAENGVVHGIDDEAVERWLTAKVYNEPIIIARATSPTDGEDGKLVFHFSTDERTGRPREIDSSGRVDYRSLDLYVPVTEGQLLVTRTAATPGEPGTTVRGNPIKQREGKEAALPRGKNITINDDRTEVRASCSGMVEYVNNALNVSNVYSVKGDCDISTGNIDFEGSVQISGTVRSGNTVKATDGIFVGGNVEAATLIAGGNIEVKGGMQGADKGSIDSKGSVSIMFVERGKISADGDIKVDVSIHSILETSSSIQALGKRGAIIGGNASAGGDIVANYIGALSNTKTSIEVGFLPRKRARLDDLQKEMEKLAANKIKLTQLDTYLEKNKATMDPATWEKLYLSGKENKRMNEESEAMTAAEIEQLREEMNSATRNKVHVLENAYGGSRITIGASTFKVMDDISFATFKSSDGEVVYGPCEKSKTDYK